MKKLLVLTLILGVASLATAGLSLVDDGAGQVGVNVDNDDAANFFLAFESPAISASNIALTDAGTGTLSSITPYGVLDGASLGLPALGLIDVYAINTASATVGDVVAGIRATADYDAAGQISLLDGSLSLVETISVVPEPATMALLGLGTLLIRRKK